MQFCDNLNCETDSVNELISNYVVCDGLVLCKSCNALKNEEADQLEDTGG